MNFIYSIAFKISGGSTVDKATQAVNRLDRGVNKVEGSVVGASRKVKQMGSNGVSAFSSMKTGAMRLLATVGVISATLGSLNATAELEGINKAITFASAGEGEKNIAFLRTTVDKFGLDLVASQSGFKSWVGGIRGTSLEGQKARDIFTGVSEAVATMGLTGEQSSGVFLALSQMASKGKVSAEELRGQLGERLPGAFGIAAKSMGVTTMELDKMMSTGKLLAEDFLPKFGAELHRTFAQSAVEAASTATANFNRFNNSVLDLKVAVGTELMPVVLSLLQKFIIPAVHWIGENIKVLLVLGSVVGGVYVGMKAYAVIMGIVNLVTSGFIGTVWKLTAAFLANPIVWVIGVLAALTAGVIYAWNNWEWFRGALTGIWGVIKETGKIVIEFLTAPLKVLGKILIGVFTLDKSMIASGLQDAANIMQNTIFKAGERIGEAWTKGYDKGVTGFRGKAEEVAGYGTYDAGRIRSAVEEAFSDPRAKKNTLANSKSLKRGISGITGGGSKVKNVTINLGKFFDQIVIQSKNMQEGTDEMVDMVLSKLTQTLNSANQVQ